MERMSTYIGAQERVKLLEKALKNGNEDVALSLLQNDAELSSGERGKKLLNESIIKSRAKILRFLLEKGTLKSLNDLEISSLYSAWACPLRHIFNNPCSPSIAVTQEQRTMYSSTLSLLIQFDESLQTRVSRYYIPAKIIDLLFFNASVACTRSVLEQLVRKGVHIDSLGAAPHGINFLIFCITPYLPEDAPCFNQLYAQWTMERASIDPLGAAPRGINPLSLAAGSHQSPEVILYLLNLNKHWEVEGDLLPLEMAVFSGNAEIAKILLESCSRYEGRLVSLVGSKRVATLVHIAAAGGLKNFHIVLNALKDLESRIGAQQQGPEFSLAALKQIEKCTIDPNFTELLRLLLKHGAQHELPIPALSLTPLHMAALLGNHTAALLLIMKKAKVDSLSAGDLTPLAFACGQGHDEMARLLEEFGAFVNSQAASKETPLHSAVAAGKSSLVQFLLDHLAYADAQTVLGNTPLHYAAMRGDLESAKILLARGADPKRPNNAGETPAQLAKGKAHFTLARLLGENVSRKDLENVFIKYHTSEIVTLCLAVDQNLLISSSRDRTIKLWDALTFDCLMTIDLKEAIANSLCYDSRNDRIVACAGGVICAWDRKTCAPLRIKFEKASSQYVFYDPNLNRIISEHCIMDATTGECICKLERTAKFMLEKMCYDPTSLQIAGGSSSGAIKIWNALNGECLACIDESPSKAFCFGPSGNELYSSSLVDLGKLQTDFIRRPPENFARKADLLALDREFGKIIFSNSNEVYAWDLDLNVIHLLKAHTCRVSALCVDSHHKRLLIGYEDGSLFIYKDGYLADHAYQDLSGSISPLCCTVS